MRKEQFDVTELTAKKIILGTSTGQGLYDESGGSLLVSNVLAENKMFVGDSNGAATAKTAAQVANLLNTAAGYTPVAVGVSVSETDSNGSVIIDLTSKGVLSTDIAIACMIAGATPQSVTKAVCTTNTLTVTLSGNGGAGTIIAFIVFRATT